MLQEQESWTTFLRDPRPIVERVEKGTEIVLNRRDGAALRVSLATRAHAFGEGLELLSQILLTALQNASEEVCGAILTGLPWTRFLPSGGKEKFLKEFLETARACASIRNPAALTEVVQAWRSTAEIYADPELAAKLSGPLEGTDIVVPRPAI